QCPDHGAGEFRGLGCVLRGRLASSRGWGCCRTDSCSARAGGAGARDIYRNWHLRSGDSAPADSDAGASLAYTRIQFAIAAGWRAQDTGIARSPESAGSIGDVFMVALVSFGDQGLGLKLYRIAR